MNIFKTQGSSKHICTPCSKPDHLERSCWHRSKKFETLASKMKNSDTSIIEDLLQVFEKLKNMVFSNNSKILKITWSKFKKNILHKQNQVFINSLEEEKKESTNSHKWKF